MGGHGFGVVRLEWHARILSETILKLVRVKMTLDEI